MTTAKIVRHRHIWQHSINGTIKDVVEKVEFKIVFSDPVQYAAFEIWVEENKGSYKYNKETNEVQGENEGEGKLPELEVFGALKEGLCWCDIMQYYLLHIAGYEFHSALNPYTGEIYIRLDKGLRE